jgi:hypothetical protein
MTVTPRGEYELEAPTAVIASYLRKTISVSYLVGLVWSGKLVMAACAALGFLYGVYTVHDQGPYYMATMRVSPAPDSGGGLDMGAAGGLLAGLTGGTATAQVPRFIQFLYALSSVEVAQGLDKKYDLLCRIYKGECDPKTRQWKPRTTIRNRITSLTFRLSGLPDPNVGPRSTIDLATYIANNVTVTQLKKTDSVNTLTYTDRNPQFSAQFLAQVVKAANDYVRAQSRESQKLYVEYLTASAAKTTNVEQRQAIDTLLLQQERQLMMTEVDIPYAVQILDGPTVTPVNRALKTIAIQTILGFAVGLAIALCRDLLPRKWRVW